MNHILSLTFAILILIISITILISALFYCIHINLNNGIVKSWTLAVILSSISLIFINIVIINREISRYEKLNNELHILQTARNGQFTTMWICMQDSKKCKCRINDFPDIIAEFEQLCETIKF